MSLEEKTVTMGLLVAVFFLASIFLMAAMSMWSSWTQYRTDIQRQEEETKRYKLTIQAIYDLADIHKHLQKDRKNENEP